MSASTHTSTSTSAALFEARNLTRRFGALVAVSDVSVALHEGEIHAVIGTNGAGKSTLINLLSGELPPSSGAVVLGGQDVTRWPQPKLAHAGIGRSYQRNNIFLPLSVFENCRLAAQARVQRPWAWWESAQACRTSTERAQASIQRAGLSAVAGRTAASLSHGQKRQLEIAMCLATEPRVLLLDEPLAGMGPEESHRMLDLLRELKRGHAILLVEHDMDAVFAVADRITVMVNGAVIATGTPDAVRTNRDVQAAYLGGH